MSQSDYIRYKKTHRVLSEYNATPNKFPVVFESGKYTEYKEFFLENTILSDTKSYDKYIPPNVPVVFGMAKPCSAPGFIMCKDTNLRGNRPEPTDTLYQFTPRIATKALQMRWKTTPTMCNYCDNQVYG